LFGYPTGIETGLAAQSLVEAIGTYSNRGHLCKKWTDLRKSVAASPLRPPLSRPDGPNPRSRRFLTAEDIAAIVQSYEAGDTTQQIGTRYGISKTRVATLLRAHGVKLHRQGLTIEQINDAATLFSCLGDLPVANRGDPAFGEQPLGRRKRGLRGWHRRG
jgi:hypothetical protein